jgi:hypothetical protein
MVQKPEPIKTEIRQFDPRELVLLEENARFMRHEQFNRLVANVRRDGRLTSVPLAWRMPDGRYQVLSGNHRTKAAVEAGLELIDVMAIDQDLSEQQRIALQLSHNAIAGEDDSTTLASLFEKLEDIDWREYSGLDDKLLDLLQPADIASISEANLDFQTLTIVFLPDELDRVKKSMEAAMALVSADETWLARYSAFDGLMEALADISKAYDVTNTATGFDLFLEVFDRHREEIRDGWYDQETDTLRRKSWIPVSSVTGLYAPAEEMRLVLKALEKIKRGDSKMPSWQALVELARRSLQE